MKPALRHSRRIVPFLIGAVLIAILIGYAPWEEVAETLQKLSGLSILALVILSLAYYALKVIRFQAMLRALAIDQPWHLVTLSYMSAQPVTLLPAGEVYRSKSLEQIAGVPLKRSLPTFTMQGLLEGAAMVVAGLISALALGHLRVPIFILSLIVLIVFIAIRLGYMATALRALNAIPYVNISRKRLQDFSEGNRAMLNLRVFPTLLVLSVATALVGGLVAYIAVVGLGGSLNGFQAVLTYIIPVLAGFVSLVPGGLGISEQSSVAILVLSGNTVALAVAATLIIRVTIVLSGVFYGLVASAVVKIRKLK